MDYDSIKILHAALPPFAPAVPLALLPYLAFLSLSLTFALAFYFSTLPKDTIPIRETVVASAASILGGFGVVALFCSVGVYL
ncbi:hypothetical protein AX14_008248 [Amanita brunnescens Koide BX004]|nr:hypothetical protein AX14_008248 [Amanita brunnescens Koide BX004]